MCRMMRGEKLVTRFNSFAGADWYRISWDVDGMLIPTATVWEDAPELAKRKEIGYELWFNAAVSRYFCFGYRNGFRAHRFGTNVNVCPRPRHGNARQAGRPPAPRS